MFFPYVIMLSIRCIYKQVYLVNIYFLIIDVNIDKTATFALQKIDESYIQKEARL